MMGRILYIINLKDRKKSDKISKIQFINGGKSKVKLGLLYNSKEEIMRASYSVVHR